VNIGSNVAEISKEDHGSKRDALPLMIPALVLRISAL
jgi:hypothetical protein